MELTDSQLLSVEEHLHDHGYIEPADIGLTWGTYTITPAGLRWLEESLPSESSTESPKEALSSPIGPAEPAEQQPAEPTESAEREQPDRDAPEREEPERVELQREEPERVEPPPDTRGTQEEGSERPWWRRVLGG